MSCALLWSCATSHTNRLYNSTVLEARHFNISHGKGKPSFPHPHRFCTHLKGNVAMCVLFLRCAERPSRLANIATLIVEVLAWAQGFAFAVRFVTYGTLASQRMKGDQYTLNYTNAGMEEFTSQVLLAGVALFAFDFARTAFGAVRQHGKKVHFFFRARDTFYLCKKLTMHFHSTHQTGGFTTRHSIEYFHHVKKAI